MADSSLSIDEMISCLVRAKDGNKEFVLMSDGDGDWTAAIGNPSSFVQMGEVLAAGRENFRTEGKTPLVALLGLMAKVIASRVEV